MFDVTFLGHQGWHFAAGGANVLLDPLLCDRFGHDPHGHEFDVFPPRRIDFGRCPPIDAVLFSHEHEDHIDGTTSLADEMRYLLERVVPRENRLEGVLLCANGYATRGDLTWMNRSVFHRDPRDVCERLRPQYGELFLAPTPGDTVTLRQG